MKKIILTILCVFPLITCSDLQSENWVAKEYQTVFDYEYQKNKYFFVSHDYRDHFETGLSHDLLHFTLDAWTQIMDLQVWVSAPASHQGVIKGVATLEPEKYTNIDIDIDKISLNADNISMHKGYFKALSPEEYGFNGDRGYFWLKSPAEDSTVVAISYVLKDKMQVGTIVGKKTAPTKVLLKLIKPKNQLPSEIYSATWPLMMKNVYSLGKNLEGIVNLNLKITEVSRTISKASLNKKPLLHVLGLDMIDEYRYYMRNGDGIVDFNSFNINLKTGILIFPGLHPFNPISESRFQIDESKKADIYHFETTGALKSQSKFKITIIDMVRSDPNTALDTDNNGTNEG